MPEFGEYLSLVEKLRIAVKTSTPAQLARYIRDIDDGYQLEDVQRLIALIQQLFIEERGIAFAQEFSQRLRDAR